MVIVFYKCSEVLMYMINLAGNLGGIYMCLMRKSGARDSSRRP